MRLIRCKDLELIEAFPGRTPPYAILSHRWTDDFEVSYGQMVTSTYLDRRRVGSKYDKIRYACEQAEQDGLDYLWVDTCCINQESSAELSEAINSMYAWYKASTCCYAFLKDVILTPDCLGFQEVLEASEWFTRGWTLQELLAPAKVVFFNAFWEPLGNRDDKNLSQSISRTTRIPLDVLTGHSSVQSQSVACRMAWASTRKTTRPEDVAYCLLGIFQVNMSLIYGEGDHAFVRLQEEIIKRSTDRSLFAWGIEEAQVLTPQEAADLRGIEEKLIEKFPNYMRTDIDTAVNVLAVHPRQFRYSGHIVDIGENVASYTLTNIGLRIELQTFKFHDRIVALLDCASSRSFSTRYAMILTRPGPEGSTFFRVSPVPFIRYHYEDLAGQSLCRKSLIDIGQADQSTRHEATTGRCRITINEDSLKHINIVKAHPPYAWHRESGTFDLWALGPKHQPRLCRLLLHVYTAGEGNPSGLDDPVDPFQEPYKVLCNIHFAHEKKQQLAYLDLFKIDDAVNRLLLRTQDQPEAQPQISEDPVLYVQTKETMKPEAGTTGKPAQIPETFDPQIYAHATSRLFDDGSGNRVVPFLRPEELDPKIGPLEKEFRSIAANDDSEDAKPVLPLSSSQSPRSESSREISPDSLFGYESDPDIVLGAEAAVEDEEGLNVISGDTVPAPQVFRQAQLPSSPIRPFLETYTLLGYRLGRDGVFDDELSEHSTKSTPINEGSEFWDESEIFRQAKNNPALGQIVCGKEVAAMYQPETATPLLFELGRQARAPETLMTADQRNTFQGREHHDVPSPDRNPLGKDMMCESNFPSAARFPPIVEFKSEPQKLYLGEGIFVQARLTRRVQHDESQYHVCFSIEYRDQGPINTSISIPSTEDLIRDTATQQSPKRVGAPSSELQTSWDLSLSDQAMTGLNSFFEEDLETFDLDDTTEIESNDSDQRPRKRRRLSVTDDGIHFLGSESVLHNSQDAAQVAPASGHLFSEWLDPETM